MEFKSNIGIPPRALESEKLILGNIIRNSEKYLHLIEDINKEAFQDSKHSIIFKCIIELNQIGVPTDIVTLNDYITKNKKTPKFAVSAYLTELVENARLTVGINLDFQVKSLNKANADKVKWTTCYKIIDAIQNRNEDEVINNLIQELATTPDNSLASNNLTPIPASELTDQPKLETIWGNFIYPGSIVQINSAPGVGKSTFIYNLCLHGASKEDFLEIPFSQKINTLYIDCETPKYFRKEKIEKICGKLPKNFHLLNDIDLSSDTNELIKLCKNHSYDLIIFDTQSRIFKMLQENDNSEANSIMNKLYKITTETDCTIILIHHITKSTETKDVYRGRGASAISAAVDIVTNLEPVDKEILKLNIVKNRLDVPSVIYMKKIGDDKFERCKEDHTKVNTVSELFKAQEFITSITKNKLSTSEILKHGKEKGYSERTLRRAISTLVESGKLEKVKRGEYCLCHNANKSNPIPENSGILAQTKEEHQIPEFLYDE